MLAINAGEVALLECPPFCSLCPVNLGAFVLYSYSVGSRQGETSNRIGQGSPSQESGFNSNYLQVPNLRPLIDRS